MQTTDTSRLQLDWGDRRVSIEYAWVGDSGDSGNSDDSDKASESTTEAPVMVFLHEGLGSIATWKDFPDELCRHLRMRGLVYSRPGYGQSTPRAHDEHWDVDFMHRQANEVLPALLHALNIHRPWLFGHSDGGSIALIYAASRPDELAGAIVLAPHLFVEAISVTSIQKVREAYLHQGLRDKLARYHDDVDSAFFGWNDVWLSARFRHWDITEDIRAIRCPVLAVQGRQDEYGTLEQIHRIRRCHASATLLELDDCGHSPHRDQPASLIAALKRFVETARQP
jgi:pimeloyl-ACP methyl ester carboxylesterase